jgi:hypothetical protein
MMMENERKVEGFLYELERCEIEKKMKLTLFLNSNTSLVGFYLERRLFCLAFAHGVVQLAGSNGSNHG